MIAYAAVMLLLKFDSNFATYGAAAQVRAALAYLTPVLLFYCGRFARLDAVKTTWIVRGGLIVCLCVAIFGLFERFVLPLSFWGELHLPQYLVMKGGLPFVSANGIEAILGSSLGRRLIGPFAYPLNASYFLILPTILSFVVLLEQRMGRYRALAALMAVLFAASEFLTLTRGAWMASALRLSISWRRCAARRGCFRSQPWGWSFWYGAHWANG